jgi:energy-coupling factor transporter ATP-binding protein EcfA2
MSGVVPIALGAAMSQAVEVILGRRGVRFRRRADGATLWYAFERCPCCGHAGADCGVAERLQGGRRVHEVRCTHPADNPWGSEQPSYADLLACLGEPVPGGLTAPVAPAGTLDKRRRRLQASPLALAHLQQVLGLTADTIARFGLGLAEPSVDRDGMRHQDALTVPLLRADGRFDRRHAYFRIPGLTRPGDGPEAWMRGAIASYWSGRAAAQPRLLVVGGIPELWRLWQQLAALGLADDTLLLASSHGSALPEEWLEPRFWRGWGQVVVALPADGHGERLAAAIASVAGREVRRLPPPGSLADGLSAAPRTAQAIEALLAAAQPMILAPEEEGRESELGCWDGAVPVELFNAHAAYRRGHLYYAVEIESRQTVLERGVPLRTATYKTVVVRSDRTVHEARTLPTPGRSGGRPVLVLAPDGARLEREPSPAHATWQWPSIEAFLAGRGETRPLAALLADLEGHLRARVWLPDDDAYALLAAGAAVSYGQSLFQAVPLFLVVGPPGTGKSALARVMVALAANAVLVGQASAATAARLLDQARGFVAFDDLEQIAAKSRGDASFSELVQGLKLSYNQATATKTWTDKQLRTQSLNFFGVKLINNTRGADAILGSRMLTIRAAVLSPERKRALGGLPQPPAIAAEALRQQLHVWAFSSVGAIAACSGALSSGPGDRAEEIAAPIRVIAQLSGDPAFRDRIERGLRRQDEPTAGRDPVAALAAILRRLAAEGWRQVAIVHLRLELALAMGEPLVAEKAAPVWQKGEWIGLQIRALGAVNSAAQGDRPRVPATRYQVRVCPLREDFLAEAWSGQTPQEKPVFAFCNAAPNGCRTCGYRPVGCPITQYRRLTGG